MENVWRKFAVHARLHVDPVSKNPSSSSFALPFSSSMGIFAVSTKQLAFSGFISPCAVHRYTYRMCAERFTFYFATNWKSSIVFIHRVSPFALKFEHIVNVLAILCTKRVTASKHIPAELRVDSRFSTRLRIDGNFCAKTNMMMIWNTELHSKPSEDCM